jgi:hypothetical protein
MRRLVTAAGALAAATLAAGCSIAVQIDSVKDPRAAFREARREAERYQGRPGPAHEVHVLVFDPDERQLVRVTAPMWLVRKLGNRIDLDDNTRSGAHAAETVRRHVRVEDIEKAGLGVLVEVAQDDADGSQVLVWLR